MRPLLLAAAVIARSTDLRRDESLAARNGRHEFRFRSCAELSPQLLSRFKLFLTPRVGVASSRLSGSGGGVARVPRGVCPGGALALHITGGLRYWSRDLRRWRRKPCRLEVESPREITT